MSAQSVLAGLMPPLENNNVLPIPWQPVAINTLARNDDIVSFLSIKCTTDTIFNQVQLSTAFGPKEALHQIRHHIAKAVQKSPAGATQTERGEQGTLQAT